MSADTQTVAIAGLGAIGGYLARALLSGAVPGLTLAAASVRDEAKAREMLGTAGASLPLVTPAALADHAAIVVEALPPAAFDSVARPAVASGARVASPSPQHYHSRVHRDLAARSPPALRSVRSAPAR